MGGWLVASRSRDRAKAETSVRHHDLKIFLSSPGLTFSNPSAVFHPMFQCSLELAGPLIATRTNCSIRG